MGGVTKVVKKGLEETGLRKKPTPLEVVTLPISEQAKAAAAGTAAASQKEEILARRRARRGGRALLSEARLTPEQGIGGQTLGSGPSV